MKESSFMIVIPMNPQDVDDPEIFLKNVRNAMEQVKSMSAENAEWR